MADQPAQRPDGDKVLAAVKAAAYLHRTHSENATLVDTIDRMEREDSIDHATRRHAVGTVFLLLGGPRIAAATDTEQENAIRRFEQDHGRQETINRLLGNIDNTVVL